MRKIQSQWMCWLMTASDDPEFHYELGVSLFIAGVQAIAARYPHGSPYPFVDITVYLSIT